MQYQRWREAKHKTELGDKQKVLAININMSSTVHIVEYDRSSGCFIIWDDIPFEATHYIENCWVYTTYSPEEVLRDLKKNWLDIKKVYPIQTKKKFYRVRNAHKEEQAVFATYDDDSKAFYGLYDEEPLEITHWAELPPCDCELGLKRWRLLYGEVKDEVATINQDST